MNSLRGRRRKGRRRADERHQAFGVLLVILQALDGEETDTEQRRDEKTAQDGCACPGPRRGHRERDEEARGQQHRRVGAPEPNLEVPRRGPHRLRVHHTLDIDHGEETAEEHHLGRKEQVHAEEVGATLLRRLGVGLVDGHGLSHG